MKKIVLPTDFSENSWNAIAYAMQLFQDQECAFYLFHVYTPVIYHTEYTSVGPDQLDFVDSVRNASQKRMTALNAKIQEKFHNANHTIETIASFDTLNSGIKNLIAEKHIDLLIMGTSGATGAKEILFGSNTMQVIKDIKCPIIAVPSNFDYEPPHEILFPTDLQIDYSKAKLNLVQEIAESHNARVNAMHVSTGYELTEKQLRNKSDLKSLFNGVGYLFHDIEMMDISEAISIFQIKHKINFLVMLNNKRSFFENLFFQNTISQIGFHMTVPFMIIPSGEL